MVNTLDRFTDDGGGGVVPSQCNTCIHFKHSDTPTCDAYPKGIPREILINKFIHTKPYKGDHGIQFAPRDEK